MLIKGFNFGMIEVSNSKENSISIFKVLGKYFFINFATFAHIIYIINKGCNIPNIHPEEKNKKINLKFERNRVSDC